MMSYFEFLTAMRKLKENEFNNEQLAALYSYFDKERDQKVSYEVFMSVIMEDHLKIENIKN